MLAVLYKGSFNFHLNINFSEGRIRKRTIYLRRKSPVGIKVSNKIAISLNLFFAQLKYNSKKYSHFQNNPETIEFGDAYKSKHL